MQASGSFRPRLAAVSYLNTVPLVWGMVAGPQQGAVELEFHLPNACAAAVKKRRVNAGLIPVIEVARQGLPVLADVGIGCRGPVKSILLAAKVAPSQIRRLAADTSSRTSVMLSRVILKHRYQAEPELTAMRPDLDAMLARADAALIIGDPALALLLAGRPMPPYVLDLGEEWWRLTGLPMVFAVWAGHTALPADLFHESYHFGAAHLEDYLLPEAQRRGLPEALAREYLTRAIHYEIGPAERRGMEEYWRLAAIMEEVAA